MEYYSNLDKYEDLSFVGDPVKQTAEEYAFPADTLVSRGPNKLSLAQTSVL